MMEAIGKNMEPIFVIPTIINDGQAPNGTKFKYFVDQNKKTWYVSDPILMVLLIKNKAYNITEVKESQDGKGTIITKLEPAANRLPQNQQPQTTRPIRQPIIKPMDRESATRLCMMAISYAKDLCINAVISRDEMYNEADKIIEWANKQTDKLTSKN